MGNELIFEGKKYISASRASELYGYSSDYIGQLCRKNIIDFRKAGRAWYVNEESLVSHKSNASAAQRGRIPGLKWGEPVFDGKKYISSSRAAKIVGYHSDYISQLCRKGVLECRKVGKTWFVSEESLQAHRATASATPRGRIPIYEKNMEGQAVVSSSGSGVAALPAINANPLSFGFNPELAYKSFHQAAINFLDRREQERQSSEFSKKVVGTVLGVVLLIVFVVPSVIGGARSLDILSQLAFGGAQASVGGNQISTSITKVKNFAVEEIDGFVKGLSFAWSGAYAFLTTGHVSQSGSSSDSENSGLVVVPSAGSAEANDQVKNYIANNFSDKTEVYPDKNGNSGLIKPVFKNKNDQSYVYVMVPIKDKNP